MQFVGATILPRVTPPSGLDIGQPHVPHSQDVGLLALRSELLDKARQWCRALQRQIWATWWAAVETGTHLGPAGSMHSEAGAVMVEAGLTVAAIQVVYEVFLSAYPRTNQNTLSSSPWEALCGGSPEGRAMSGLKLIRNGEMHANSIVVPEVDGWSGLLSPMAVRATESFRSGSNTEVFRLKLEMPDIPLPQINPTHSVV